MRKDIKITILLFAAFMVWTAVICLIDVQPVGPCDTTVGLATFNSSFHSFTGVHMPLYILTDWLGLVPLGIMILFALLGLFQWLRRKSLMMVDRSLLTLGGFYLVVLSVYLIFEFCVVNYRPILINNNLEASYPSSTTILALCIIPTACMQIKTRIKSVRLRYFLIFLASAFTVFMVLGRLISGVHWFSDIVGGCLISAALVQLYSYISGLK